MTTAKIGHVRPIRTADTSLIMLPLMAADPKHNASFNINLTSPIGTQISCDDLRLAFPELLGKTDVEILHTVLKNELEGRDVAFDKVPQANGEINPNTREPYYNIRLASQLKSAKDDEINTLLASMGYAGAPTKKASKPEADKPADQWPDDATE